RTLHVHHHAVLAAATPGRPAGDHLVYLTAAETVRFTERMAGLAAAFASRPTTPRYARRAPAGAPDLPDGRAPDLPDGRAPDLPDGRPGCRGRIRVTRGAAGTGRRDRVGEELGRARAG